MAYFLVAAHPNQAEAELNFLTQVNQSGKITPTADDGGIEFFKSTFSIKLS